TSCLERVTTATGGRPEAIPAPATTASTSALGTSSFSTATVAWSAAERAAPRRRGCATIWQLTRRPARWPCGTSPSTRLLRSEEHTSELQSRGHLVCRLLLEKKKHELNDVEHQACQSRD